jgi:quercetin dioxygenase-like cupin family protein
LYNFGLGVLTASVTLMASALCLQAAILGQDNGGKADDRPSVDLRSGFDSGRKQKLRLFTLVPGGTLELHSQKDHPVILHVIKGTLTSRSQGKPEVVLRAGVGLAEDKGSDYSVRNTGAEPVEFIWLPVYESIP